MTRVQDNAELAAAFERLERAREKVARAARTWQASRASADVKELKAARSELETLEEAYASAYQRALTQEAEQRA